MTWPAPACDGSERGEAEVAAIDRLAEGRADLVDLRRLAPLAEAAGLPWRDMYPEIYREADAVPPPGEFRAVDRLR